MRDIKPAQSWGSRKPDHEEESEGFDLYEAGRDHRKGASRLPPPQAGLKKSSPPGPKSEPPAETSPPPASKPKFSGSKVPVSKIPVPDNIPETHSNEDHEFTERPAAGLYVGSRKEKTKKPRLKVQVGPQERRWLLVFFGLVIVLAGIAAVIFLPTASVNLKLRTAPLLVDEQLMVGTDDGQEGKAVPGSAFFREVLVSGAVRVENTEMVGEKATGTVQIVNRTVGTQKIVERSRLVTEDGQLFYMQKHAIVPPQSSVNVPVEADKAGQAGNIEPQRLDFAALDKNSRQLVYAQAAEKFTGGSGEEVAVVSDSDIQRARKQAGEEARVRAESEIRQALPDGWTILEESWTGEVISFEPGAEVGDKTPELSYQANMVVRVAGYKKEVLEEKLKASLEQRLDEDYMLFPGPISYKKSVNDIDWEKGQVALTARVTHTTIPKLSLDTLRDKLAGRSRQETQQYLEGLPGVQDVEVKLWPFWAQSVPRIKQRISLELLPEQQP